MTSTELLAVARELEGRDPSLARAYAGEAARRRRVPEAPTATTVPRRRRRRKVYVLAGLVAALVVVGAAYAAWTVLHTDQSGRAQVGAAPVEPDVTPAAAPPADGLFPGETASLYIDTSNPNPYALTLTAAAVTGSAVFTVHKPLGTVNAACPTSNFTANSVSGLSVAIPAGSSTNIAVPGAVSMSASAPIECAGSYVWLAAADAITYTFAK